MMSGSTSARPRRLALMASMRLESRSSARSRTPWVVAFEIHAIDDPLEQRVSVGNCSQVCRELLADFVGKCANDRPHPVVRIARLERQVEAHKLLVVFHEPKRLGPRADLLRDPVDLVV